VLEQLSSEELMRLLEQTRRASEGVYLGLERLIRHIDQIIATPDGAQVRPIQSLSGKRRGQLMSALVSAFPSYNAFTRMLDIGVDKKIVKIAPESDALEDIAYKVIITAEAQGWLDDLVHGASSQNSGNTELRAFKDYFDSLFK
jgi:hypothetical protein